MALRLRYAGSQNLSDFDSMLTSILMLVDNTEKTKGIRCFYSGIGLIRATIR
jgi:hypothetical protein